MKDRLQSHQTTIYFIWDHGVCTWIQSKKVILEKNSFLKIKGLLSKAPLIPWVQSYKSTLLDV